MLEELLKRAAGHVEISEAAPGVRCCELDVRPEAGKYKLSGGPGRLEVFFCILGELTAGEAVCSARRVLLLYAADCTLELTPRRLQGVLVSAGLKAGEGITALFAGGSADPERVAALVQEHGGVMEAGQGAWSEAVFSALRELEPGERAAYCAVKAAELLYLISRRPSGPRRTRYRDPYLIDTVRRIHGHMMANLGDRLTIGELSAAFHIAPTSFKECFRELYGESVHAYLLDRRMERACQLLSTTSIPVFRIAESIGYGSASQFGVEFKRRYSLSPMAYRRAMREKNV